MPLDEKVLAEAKKLRERSIDAQFEADRTALAYQHAIRKLNAAGGSLREIADALGLSHQRVHQIVDPDSGKQGLKQERRGRAKRKLLRCSFCGRWQADVRKLIAGPAGICICDDCVELASAAVEEERAQSDDRTTIHPIAGRNPTCDFCGKRAKQVEHLVMGPGFETEEHVVGVTICNECLDLCREILGEE